MSILEAKRSFWLDFHDFLGSPFHPSFLSLELYTMDNNKRDGSPIQGQNKPTKAAKRELDEILVIARSMWNREDKKVRSEMTEDRNFRETFGCGAHTALTTWEMLVDASFLPTNGCLHHLLWALMFMKVYAKEMTMCALAGAIDPGTWRKWTWIFIRAIVSLEPLVVSFSIPYAVTCRIISNLSLILMYRLSGKIDS